MTNKEALIVEVGIDVTDGMLLKGLADVSLSSNDTYFIANDLKISTAAMKVLFGASLLKSVSEGGYSLSFDTDAIKARIKYLAYKTGDNSILNAVESKPKVRRVNVW